MDPSIAPPKRSVPPPPPPGKGILISRKSGKLNRSNQIGTLYNLLRNKLEGTGTGSSNKKSISRSISVGNSSGGKGSLSDALLEMTNKSKYILEIEEDYENHQSSIIEIKSAIIAFKTTNMIELLKFHQHVEDHLQCLRDQIPVLRKFENFPFQKLEMLRLSAGNYLHLDGVVSTLKGWRFAPITQIPLLDQLDKIENYFNKIEKKVIVEIESNKETDIKNYTSQNITFDYTILTRLKEAMVDLSSSCIEMALKVSKEAKEAGKAVKLGRVYSNLLWRVFQIAYRVYKFAGGQDDRADRLTSELATEIQTYLN